MKLLRPFVLALALPLLASIAPGVAHAAPAPLLLRHPALGPTQIAFVHADDIWVVPRAGGEARRLTSNAQVIAGPWYSPDYRRIAYSSAGHGSADVYVIDAGGGVPQRLTWDPTGSLAAGWTPDGQSVLFTSQRQSVSDFPRLFTIRADGQGPASVLPLPSAAQGSYSPDGARLAYVPVAQWQPAWKRYRGGQTTPIWIVDLKTLEVEPIPRDNSNDAQPAWMGPSVYFLSDRDGPVSLYAYDTAAHRVERLLDNHGLDLKWLAAGAGGLVYEQFGSLHVYDPATREQHEVPVTLGGELTGLEPHIAPVGAKEVQSVGLSPTGARLVVEAHGEIFTVPAEKGDTRDLTRTPGAAERDPAWSPDGKSIAYFGDESGEYKLYVRSQDGLAPPRAIDLGPDPSFFYSPRWSPDSKHIAYSDKHLRLWVVDVEGGRPVKIDTGLRGSFGSQQQLSWSPDSQWIAYVRDLESQVHAIFLHSLATHASTQVTDGMSDAANPVFDPDGKYLYFTASTDNGPSNAGIDLSSLDRATVSSPYVLVLAKATPSPVPPQSDDEGKKDDDKKNEDKKKEDAGDKDAATGGDGGRAQGPAWARRHEGREGKQQDKAKEKPAKVPPTVIDLAGLGNRILALPVPARNWVDLQVGKSGVLFLAEGPAVGRPSADGNDPPATIWRFTTEKRETERLLGDVNAFRVSRDGEKAFYAREANWFIAPVGELKPSAADGTPGKPVNNGGMVATIDRRAEWRQMFDETWRIERDFFYDPGLHGLDVAKVKARYRPFLAGLASRSEFTDLCIEMLGELSLGHVFVGGPRGGNDEAPRPGLLGADYVLDHDRYRFARVYNGQNWTPALAAPLTQPGIDVAEGDYLLAVAGRELHASDNIDAFFDGLAGKQVVLRVARDAAGTGARDVTVVPTASEYGLRNLAWIDGNRRKVEALSGGKVAYVYMPNTGGAGYSNFNRHFYAQLDKQGLVLDERYNEGGFIADYVVNTLAQKRLSGAIERDGKPVHDPMGAIFGAKAMIINQSAGSGGDAMPWYFRKMGLGPLVGTRTWGGLVGIGGYPQLLDGGRVTAPRYAIYGLDGDWEVEGHGIAPDIEVQEWPRDVAAGHDLQLERAVQAVMQGLAEHPVVEPKVPPYPDYHRNDGLGRP